MSFANQGEAAVGIPAVQILLNDLLDHRPEILNISATYLKTCLLPKQKTI